MQDDIIIIDSLIARSELKDLAQKRFGDLVKATVDIERGIMAIGGELHADEEQLLLQNGSQQNDLWGINLYPDIEDESWIEFDSIINIRPSQGNRSRSVEDQNIRKRIIAVVKRLVTE